MLLENRATLDRIAESLLERETLDTADLRLLIAGEPLPPLALPTAGEPASPEPRREAKVEPLPKFSGKKLPDPEPIPGSPQQPKPAKSRSTPTPRQRKGGPSMRSPIFPRDRVTIVGVLNATPDSFSDGGRFVAGDRIDVDAVVAEALRMQRAGAHVLDVGGESTRPGAAEVPVGDRDRARRAGDRGARQGAAALPLSIDTRKAPSRAPRSRPARAS